MQIAVPLRSPDEVERLVRAGADEFYAGVMDDPSSGYCPNARPMPSSNLRSFEDLKESVARAGSAGVPVMFCANAPLAGWQADRLKADVLRACEAGVAGIITAEPSMLPWLARRAPGLTITAGTLAGTFNSLAVDFLAGAGAARVVLDRLLTLTEIGRLAAHAAERGVQLEAFVADIGCVHVNAVCLFHQWSAAVSEGGGGHPKAAACRVRMPLSVWERSGELFSRRVPGHEYAAADPWTYCATCSLFHLHRCGIAVAKIIGRHRPLEALASQVAMVKAYLRLLDQGELDASNYVAAGRRLHREHLGSACDASRCFYHEVRRDLRGGA
ncbi:MAG: U32 family peptidase [Elusimicrobia bacterium]|nr:U32 family peptidase [Elusimicrobiota bacterium]